MAKPKKNGGLSFKDITAFNNALLAKLGWRILKNPTCLLARCLLRKYCHSEPFLTCKPSRTSSHGWKSVLIGRDLLVKQLGWVIGNGESVNVWSEPWLSHNDQIRPFGSAPENYLSLTVADLLLPESTEWNLEMIEQILPFHKDQILNIKTSKAKVPDELVWLKKPKWRIFHQIRIQSTKREKHRHNYV